MSNKTKYVYARGEAYWAKLKEDNRDTGKYLPEDSDVRKKLESIDGQYTIDLHMTDEDIDNLVKDGVPNKGLHSQNFKEDGDGNKFYRFKRPHVNPKITDKDGEPLFYGPPQVLIKDGDENVPFDGLIGNGSDVIVKATVYDSKIVTMQAVKIIDLIEYEAPDVGDNDF